MRIHYLNKKQGVTTTPLSILDNAVARFSPTGAVFLFPSQSLSTPRPASDFVLRLISSLQRTLDDFPHFCGRLNWIPGAGGRLQIIYGGGEAEDPGVEVEELKLDQPLCNFHPSALSHSDSGVGTVDVDLSALEPSGKLQLWDLEETEGLAAVIVRVTTLQDGYAIGVKMAHVLGDAQCLIGFVKRWAEFCINGNDGKGIEGSLPVFEPALLDSAASKKGGNDHEEIMERVRTLPCHRFDWWANDAPGYPSWAKATTENSKKLAGKEEASKDRTDLQPPPWESWDMTQPVDHLQVHFSNDQLQKLKESSNSTSISRLDALLAYIWTMINKARYPTGENYDETVYLDLTLGARPRTSPPLPDSFVGSPIFLAYVTQHASAFNNEGAPAALAADIRNTLKHFDSRAIADLLLDVANEPVPNRRWQAFLGGRHTLVTSWLRLGCYDIDFGSGKPVEVSSIMPSMDGCVCIMDSPPRDGGGWVANIYLERGGATRVKGLLTRDRGNI